VKAVDDRRWAKLCSEERFHTRLLSQIGLDDNVVVLRNTFGRFGFNCRRSASARAPQPGIGVELTDISQNQLGIRVRRVLSDDLRKDTTEPSTGTGDEDDISSVGAVSVGSVSVGDSHCRGVDIVLMCGGVQSTCWKRLICVERLDTGDSRSYINEMCLVAS
jgi:hypothetical protein